MFLGLPKVKNVQEDLLAAERDNLLGDGCELHSCGSAGCCARSAGDSLGICSERANVG